MKNHTPDSTPKRIDLDRLALDLGMLRIVIDQQMKALQSQGRGTNWLRFQRTPAWEMMKKECTAETQARYELAWRMRYKKGVWKAWLAEQVKESHLVKMDLSVIKREEHLSFAASWMVWAELHDDRPHVFTLVEPRASDWGLQVADAEAIKMALLMQKNWLWGQLVEGRPEWNTERFVSILCPLGMVYSTRWEKDVDVRDWQAVILEGLAEGYSIVDAQDHADVIVPPGRNLYTPGTIIGSGTGKVYQRGPGGNLVNITKHPHKLRTDLPGFRTPRP